MLTICERYRAHGWCGANANCEIISQRRARNLRSCNLKNWLDIKPGVCSSTDSQWTGWDGRVSSSYFQNLYNYLYRSASLMLSLLLGSSTQSIKNDKSYVLLLRSLASTKGNEWQEVNKQFYRSRSGKRYLQTADWQMIHSRVISSHRTIMQKAQRRPP